MFARSGVSRAAGSVGFESTTASRVRVPVVQPQDPIRSQNATDFSAHRHESVEMLVKRRLEADSVLLVAVVAQSPIGRRRDRAVEMVGW